MKHDLLPAGPGTRPRLRGDTGILVLFGTIAALYLAREILIPFAFALTLTFLLAPVVALLQKLHTGRVVSVLTTVLVSIAVAGGIGWIIATRELEVHLDREEPLEFRTASQNHIVVELLPGVPANMKWPVTQSTEPVSTQSRGVSGSGRQGELPLKSSFAEPVAGGLSGERQSAINDLERAVERVKLILKEPSQNPNTMDKEDVNKRRKKH